MATLSCLDMLLGESGDTNYGQPQRNPMAPERESVDMDTYMRREQEPGDMMETHGVSSPKLIGQAAVPAASCSSQSRFFTGKDQGLFRAHCHEKMQCGVHEMKSLRVIAEEYVKGLKLFVHTEDKITYCNKIAEPLAVIDRADFIDLLMKQAKNVMDTTNRKPNER
jgi:hypothetical protein